MKLIKDKTYIEEAVETRKDNGEIIHTETKELTYKGVNSVNDHVFTRASEPKTEYNFSESVMSQMMSEKGWSYQTWLNTIRTVKIREK
jgi:hypothetical protein